MIDIGLDAHATDVPALVIVFRNDREISAAELGELLSALAADYRRLTKGRSLIVSRIESGSLRLWLRELLDFAVANAPLAMEYLRAARDLKRLYETLRDLIGTAKANPRQSDLFRNRQRPGLRSVERLVNIAIAAGGELELQYQGPDGESLKVKYTAPEARQIKEQVESFVPKRPLPGPQYEVEQALEPGRRRVPATEQRLDELVDALALEDAQSVDIFVETLVSTLREAGREDSIELIAARLEARNLGSIAAKIRTAAGKRSSRGNTKQLR